jgi:hypothetical protein
MFVTVAHFPRLYLGGMEAIKEQSPFRVTEKSYGELTIFQLSVDAFQVFAQIA